ncbi:MAG: PDDEXK family nuclease [Acidimicrobiales bacterium]
MTSSTLSDDARRRHPSAVPALDQSFAHPSERLFSQLLTLYGHEWVYEPLEFPLAWNDRGVPTRGFRPDFFLPARRVFIELTVLEQRLVTKKNKKVRRFRDLYPEIPLLVVYQRDYDELLRHHDLRFIDGRAA